jgi:hypothetical protein
LRLRWCGRDGAADALGSPCVFSAIVAVIPRAVRCDDAHVEPPGRLARECLNRSCAIDHGSPVRAFLGDDREISARWRVTGVFVDEQRLGPLVAVDVDEGDARPGGLPAAIDGLPIRDRKSGRRIKLCGFLPAHAGLCADARRCEREAAPGRNS